MKGGGAEPNGKGDACGSGGVYGFIHWNIPESIPPPMEPKGPVPGAGGPMGNNLVGDFRRLASPVVEKPNIRRLRRFEISVSMHLRTFCKLCPSTMASDRIWDGGEDASLLYIVRLVH